MEIVSLPYQRLKNEDLIGDHYEEKEGSIVRKSRNFQKFKTVRLRKRFRVKVPSLRRFWRKKVKLVYSAYAKVLKRFKGSQAHFGDLFAGNYLFLQVNPSSLKCFEKAYHGSTGLSSRYSLPKMVNY